MSAATETLNQDVTTFKRGEDRCDRCSQYARKRMRKLVADETSEKIAEFLLCNHHYNVHMVKIASEKWEVFSNDDAL